MPHTPDEERHLLETAIRNIKLLRQRSKETSEELAEEEADQLIRSTALALSAPPSPKP